MSVPPRARWQIVVALVLLGLGITLALQPQRRPIVAGENYGYTPNPEGVAEFLNELGDQRFFSQAAPEAMAQAERVDTFLYRAMAKAHQARYGRPWICEKQGIGDCVAWGAMHAVWCSESISWDLGQVAEPPMLPSPEALYGGSRVEARNKPEGSGGWSDGSYGGAAARWLRDWGVVYRQPFQDLGYDLTSYSSERAKQWGNWGAGGQGDKGRLDAIAKRHPARYVVAVKTWDECVAALTSGFPITIASSQGFASRTDESGVLAPSGTWMHQMCLVAIRFADKAPPGVRKVDACLVLNSWGTKWLTYAGKYPADQPDGSFWAERSVVEKILRQNDSYAIGDIKTGFKWRDLHNGNWLMPAPIDSLSSSDPSGSVSLTLAY